MEGDNTSQRHPGALEVSDLMKTESVLCTSPDMCDDTMTTAAFEPLDKLFVTPLGFKAAYLAVGAFGMIGNLMVIVVILNCTSLRRTFTNKFICNQSLIDFFSSFFILTTNMIRDPAPEILGDSIAQDVWCHLWMTKWPLFGTFMASTFNLVAMTFERYYAIVYPLHHSRSFTKKKAYIIMGLVWIVGPGWHASYGVSSTTRVDGVCRTGVYPSVLLRKVITTIVITVQFITPIIAISVAYIHIFITLRRSSENTPMDNCHDVREERMRTARKNVIKTLVKVFACFICCWTPNQTFLVGWNYGYTFTPDATYYHISVLFIFVNSVINPVVYTLTYQQFQAEQKRLLCGMCWSEKHKSSTELSTDKAASTEVTTDRSSMASAKF